LKNKAKNEFFTIRPLTYIIDNIDLFLEAISRLPIVKGDSGRVREATIVMSPVAGALRALDRAEIPNHHVQNRRQRRTEMALKVELKPHERIIIGNCVITNTDQRARLLIDGDKIPILREKDILTPETADTPAKLIYLAVQLMYISPDPHENHGTYFNLVRDVVTVAPSAWPLIENINTNILNGELYHALKEAKKLVAYEKKLLESARDKQVEAA
jgi:flagellar protein FlbT